jgi:hypothetical protein
LPGNLSRKFGHAPHRICRHVPENHSVYD